MFRYSPDGAIARGTIHKATPLARKVHAALVKAGDEGLSTRDAYMLLQETTGGSFTRRITELSKLGFQIRKERKVNPLTGKRYSRYFLDGYQMPAITITVRHRRVADAIELLPTAA